MEKDYILYLGNYLDEKIVAERKLPTHNIAGSNRMQRLSIALSYYFYPLIISPGVSMRVKRGGNLFLKSKIHRNTKFKVFYTAAVGIPYLSVLVSYVAYFITVFRLLNKTKAKNVVVYNFDPLLVLIVFFIRIRYPKVKIANNIEDISIPKLSDFSKESEDRGLQQRIFFVCMKFVAYMSHGYIIPTSKFIDYLPSKKNVLIITGCITVKDNYNHEVKDKLHLLFAGKIAFEHGIDVFIDSLKLLEKSVYSKQLQVDISGGSSNEKWLKEQILNFKNLNVRYHGFVSNEKYSSLLADADVCIALQKDTGRHSKFKTPSKVYEYLGNAKIVIATDVGDLSQINNEYIKICKPVTAENLKDDIIDLVKNKPMIAVTKEKVHHFAKKTYDTKSIGNKLFEFLSKNL